MKHIIILGDGMSDEPLADYDNKTPLQMAKKPHIDWLAKNGRSGLFKTVPETMHPGSEIANMAVLGYDVEKVFEGRGVLEAASMGVELQSGDLALRCNLLTIENEKIKNHSAEHISSEEAATLIQFLNERLGNETIQFYSGVSYRHLLVVKNGLKFLDCTPPHDVTGTPFRDVLVQAQTVEAQKTADLLNSLILESQKLLSGHPINIARKARGKDPANSIWPWSPGYKPAMPTLKEMFGIEKSAVISAVDLIHGIGVYAGMDVIHVEGVTGLYDTNYEGKAKAAIDALKTHDFVYLHIEASDEAGHEGDVELKTRTIEYLDERVVKYILEETAKMDEPVTIAILPDHPTPCALKTHTRDAVPFTIYNRDIQADDVEVYDEFDVRKGAYGTVQGDEFIRLLLSSSKMNYYSTNKETPEVSLKEAVIKGLAADKGLFMPERIKKFEPSFFDNIQNLTFQEIAYEVALKFFGEDIQHKKLKEIVYETLEFDCPLVKVTDSIYALELFHGPTLAFKDVGARFMARLLNYFMADRTQQVNVLVATSGDTGSAVANGFLGVDGIHVYVLYPKGKVSRIQESQFTTLGQNITALEIDGTFDDCQHLVKTAFLDGELNEKLILTSANSINVARFLPQAFYYFNAYARLKEMKVIEDKEIVFSVPSGNLGNITAGLFAREMGLPVSGFIAANNANRVVFDYLKTGKFQPKPSVETVANAMDVGAPSNFVRILDLYGHSHKIISEIIKGYWYSDEEIEKIIKSTFDETGYMCDPHGACAYQSLQESLGKNQIGVFLETAHPAKFLERMDEILGEGKVSLPGKLIDFLKGERSSISLQSDYQTFKQFLLSNAK